MKKISDLNENFFVIIGGQRCGTTYLYHLLDEHPEILMIKPVRPEPKLFLKEEKLEHSDKVRDNLFRASYRVKIFGEKSTSYYEKPEIAQRIKFFSKSAKVILLLRNPSQRAISNYFFSVENGFETRSLDDVFLNELPEPINKMKTSVSPFNYLERGNYSKFISPYMDLFKENLKVLIFEELIAEENTIQEVYNFLNVNKKFMPKSIGRKINESRNKHKINIEVLKKLQHYYKNEIEILETELDKNLSIWK